MAIEEKIQISEARDIPLSLNPFLPDQEKRTIKTEADLAREYVASRIGIMFNALQTLPNNFDELTQKFGIGVFNRMLEDAEVAASYQVLQLGATAQDGLVIPGVDSEHPEYKKAVEIARFHQRMIDNLNTPLTIINEQMLDGLVHGSAVGECVYKVQDHGQDKGKIVLHDVKKRPLENTSYAVDAFNNVVGILATRNFGVRIPIGTVFPISAYDNNKVITGVIPRSKFMIFTWNTCNGDPRGRSILRPAYSAWWVKQQAIQLMTEWAAKYAQPSFWATVPEDAIDEYDDQGNVIKATQYLAAEGQKFANSTFAAFAHGTELHMIETRSNGEAFKIMFDFLNTEIRRSILNQSLATAEASHNSKAAAMVHQDMLGMKIVKIKNMLGEMWRRDVFKFTTTANFGADSIHLVPKLDLGEGSGFPPDIGEISRILGREEDGKWQPSAEQWSRIEKKYNLPVRKVINEREGSVSGTVVAEQINQNNGDTGNSQQS